MTSRVAASPERRQLTVMFCDLVDSTSLAQLVDPEDLRASILRFQQLVRDGVARYGGYVARYMGDGVLVYFGFPLAHEDDAARAVYAGLDLIETSQQAPLLDPDGARVQLRIGVATGLVVVGDQIGSGAAQELAAVGETLNLASRLQGCAGPNTVQVSARTHRLAGDRFVYGEATELRLKGYAEPVQGWRVLHRSSDRFRFAQSKAAALTPWVGRSDELTTLLHAWRCAETGFGQVVVVTGEAGVGKSRLVHAFTERIQTSACHVQRYQCSPYHMESALHPLIHQLEKAAGFEQGESAEGRLAKLKGLLERSSIAAKATMPLVAALLSLPTPGSLRLTAEQRKQHTMAAVLHRLKELASQHPVLLMLEDAHWVDPSTLDLIDLLCESLPALPVLLVVTTRSASPARDSLSAPVAGVVRLQRLSPAEAEEMAAGVNMPTQAASEQLAQVLARADGMPLFIEELARAIAAGLQVAEVPPTLQDLLMGELDSLGHAKEVAQVAAVVGREFADGFIANLLGISAPQMEAALSVLVGAHVVEPCDGKLAFRFRHSLIQDAAYGSLLRGRRKELHGAVAAALETIDPLEANGDPEPLARHYALADRPAMAARWYGRAAMRALGRSANVEAVRHCERAGHLLEGMPETPERKRIELTLGMLGGAAHRAIEGFASPRAAQLFLRALAVSEELGDVATQVDVRRGLFSWHYAKGELVQALAQGHRVTEVGAQTGERGACMLGHWMVGAIALWQGRVGDARVALEQAGSLYRPEDHAARTLTAQIDPGVNAMAHLSWVYWFAGESDRAVDTSQRAMQAARSLAQPYALTMALFFACAVRACRAEHDLAEPLLHELFTVSEEQGLTYLHACAWVLRGQVCLSAGQDEGALQAIDSAVQEFDALNAHLGRPWALCIAAAALERLDRKADGLRRVGEALHAMECHGERLWEAEILRTKAKLLWPSKVAHHCARRADEVAQQQGANALATRVLSMG